MKILINNIYYYPNMAGGAEVSVKKLSEALAVDSCNDVHVLCASDDERYVVEHINNVTVHRIPLNGNTGNKLLCRINRVFNITDYKKIKKILTSISPDVIHTNNLRTFSVAIWKIANDLNIPVVHTLRDYVLIDIYRYSVEKLVIGKLTNIVNTVTAPSEYTLDFHTRNLLFEETGHKEVVFNAIDFDLREWDRLYDKKKNMMNQPIKFAYLGRFSEEKGVDWLISVFNKCNTEHSLFLFGNGQLNVNSQQILLENASIIDCGKLSEHELNHELEQIDVIIVPSLWEEPFGRVILDAYKHAIPVIVTNRGGMPEIVDEGQTGIILKNESDDELAKAIEFFMDRGNILKLLPNIRNKLMCFSIGDQASKFINIYRAALND